MRGLHAPLLRGRQSRAEPVEFYVSTTSQSLGVAWIDINGDLYPDLYVVNGFEPGEGSGGDPARGSHHLFFNRGDGTFSQRDDLLPELGPELEMAGVVFGDYDNDGDSDLFVYNQHEILLGDSPLNPGDGPANLLLQNQAAQQGCSVETPCDEADLQTPLFFDVAASANADGDVDGAFGVDYPARRTLSASFLDADRDGCLDLATAQWHIRNAGEQSNQNVLLRGDCTVAYKLSTLFEDATAESGLPFIPAAPPSTTPFARPWPCSARSSTTTSGRTSTGSTPPSGAIRPAKMSRTT